MINTIKKLCLLEIFYGLAFKYAITSILSFLLSNPAYPILFPGANPEGLANHLSKFASFHFSFAFPCRAPE